MTFYIWNQLCLLQSFQHNRSSVLRDASHSVKQCGRKKFNVSLLYMYLSNFRCVMGSTYIGQFAPLVFAESWIGGYKKIMQRFLAAVTMSAITLTWKDLGSSSLRQLLLRWTAYVYWLLELLSSALPSRFKGVSGAQSSGACLSFVFRVNLPHP